MTILKKDLQKIFTYLMESDPKFNSMPLDKRKNLIEDQVVVFYDLFLEEAKIKYSKSSTSLEKEKMIEDYMTQSEESQLDELIDVCMKKFIGQAFQGF